MEPEFSMCDEVQAELMKREAASELFEEAFENDSIIDSGSFKAFLRLYSEERSDERFIDDISEEITEYIHKLESSPNFATELEEMFVDDDEKFKATVLEKYKYYIYQVREAASPTQPTDRDNFLYSLAKGAPSLGEQAAIAEKLQKTPETSGNSKGMEELPCPELD
jgi:hypothetical protein